MAPAFVELGLCSGEGCACGRVGGAGACAPVDHDAPPVAAGAELVDAGRELTGHEVADRNETPGTTSYPWSATPSGVPR